MLKPFVKWVGGKRQLLKELRHKSKDFNFEEATYFEPFVGGGAFLLDVLPKNAVISDMNLELVKTWNIIKDNKDAILVELNEYVKQHNRLGKEFYLKIRDMDVNELTDIQIAARFIYLNKTGFNGMYRVNSKGKFNVPFNGKTNINLDNLAIEENLSNISNYLNSVNFKIYHQDFEKTLFEAKRGDFIFADPPYDSDTNTFDSYIATPFGKEGQVRLANVLKEMHKRGVKWILTNHNTILINELYKDFNIKRVVVNRSINSVGSKRKQSAEEVIITNF
jgi:DNA adenine methylase